MARHTSSTLPVLALLLGASACARCAEPSGPSVLPDGGTPLRALLDQTGRSGALDVYEACAERREEARALLPLLARRVETGSPAEDAWTSAVVCLSGLGRAAAPALPQLRAAHDGLPQDDLMQTAITLARARAGDGSLVPALQRGLASADLYTPRLALDALEALGPDGRAALPDVASLLEGVDPSRAAEAAEVLALMQDPRAVPRLAALLRQGHNWHANLRAADALARLADPAGMAALRHAAQHHPWSYARARASAAAMRLEANQGGAPHPYDPEEGAAWVRTIRSRQPPLACRGAHSGEWRVRDGKRALRLRSAGLACLQDSWPEGFPAAQLHWQEGLPQCLTFTRVGEGWLVARNAGEFGAGLRWVTGGGQALLLPEDKALKALLPWRGGYLAIGGAQVLEEGAVWRLTPTASGPWSVTLVVGLPDEPRAWALQSDGTLHIATERGAVAVGPEGSLREVECLPPLEESEPAPRWKDLTPEQLRGR